ncbi:hypothetical protein BDK51DRAFT_31671 [Blyttiomyces helicus]|uniref:F-box domain-containing protein n=1 Tax=Blyttiomyces helicus TaxID=388810 RepID=A0A4P9WRS4_9FUNG|nr:hypothetical protein BDK51DRAFT_31671 [Blyttiomyces helicus]|eukprot:RKO93636.1 hypothetical protein BDK51DRAFT_31671 [Blyttiomyces helicus]
MSTVAVVDKPRSPLPRRLPEILLPIMQATRGWRDPHGCVDRGACEQTLYAAALVCRVWCHAACEVLWQRRWFLHSIEHDIDDDVDVENPERPNFELELMVEGVPPRDFDVDECVEDPRKLEVLLDLDKIFCPRLRALSFSTHISEAALIHYLAARGSDLQELVLPLVATPALLETHSQWCPQLAFAFFDSSEFQRVRFKDWMELGKSRGALRRVDGVGDLSDVIDRAGLQEWECRDIAEEGWGFDFDELAGVRGLD